MQKQSSRLSIKAFTGYPACGGFFIFRYFDPEQQGKKS
jgi:hypothetical protein